MHKEKEFMLLAEVIGKTPTWLTAYRVQDVDFLLYKSEVI